MDDFGYVVRRVLCGQKRCCRAGVKQVDFGLIFARSSSWLLFYFFLCEKFEKKAEFLMVSNCLQFLNNHSVFSCSGLWCFGASTCEIMFKNRCEVLGNRNGQSRYFRVETSTHSPEQDAKIDVSKTPISR